MPRVAIERLGHDLKGPPAAADHPHLDQLEAHIAEGRLDQMRYLVKECRPYANGNTKGAGARPLSGAAKRGCGAEYGGSVRRCASRFAEF